MTALAPTGHDASINGVALTVLIVLFALVTGMGFWASRWRQADSMESLDEWGLGGRSFGTWVTWFLLGGDLYTAYTFVAVPAAMFALGSVVGLLRGALHDRALPDHLHLHGPAVVGQPPARLRHHRPTSCAGRYGSRGLSLAVAVTGILATMPYIALQLVGIQAVLEVVGVGGGERPRQGPAAVHRVRPAGRLHLLQRPARPGGHRVRQGRPDLPRHHRGDHLPADQGRRLGPHLRRGRRPRWPSRTRSTGKPTGAFIPGGQQYWAYATLGLRLGARAVHVPALDHGDPVGSSRNTIRRNASILPAYSLRARPAGPARLGGDRGRHQADRPRRQAERPARHPAAVRGHVPELVRRRGLRGHRHRGARAGGHHVDRGGQHLHPQHLQDWHQAGRDARAGGQGLQARLAAGQGVRAGLRPDRSTSRTRSTSSCSAASGSCRPSRRSCSASTPAGSTAGPCSPAGRSAWSTAPSPAYNVINPATKGHFGGSLDDDPGDRPDGLHRA